jgi:hypothetical protein
MDEPIENEQLTKIHLELPNHPGSGGESFWAKPLGDDLYELRNSPWFAYNLHFMDVVFAQPPTPDKKPEIIKVVRRSGHKTLRVWFLPEFPLDHRQELLVALNKWKGFFENADGQLYAIDVEPDGDYEAICNQLWEWEQEKKLVYEKGATGNQSNLNYPSDPQISSDGISSDHPD